jgi:hypothetical protein
MFSQQACAFNPFFEDCFVFQKHQKDHIIRPTANTMHHQQIEIILDDFKTDESITSTYNTEILITPSPTANQLQNLEIPNDTTNNMNNNNKTRSTSADIYLQSPNQAKSSSSSNLSMHFERNKDESNKLLRSAIYSTESVGSTTSSFSSNLVNSSPSPSFQQNKSQELINSAVHYPTNANAINNDLFRPAVANELKIPQPYKNVQLSYNKSNSKPKRFK